MKPGAVTPLAVLCLALPMLAMTPHSPVFTDPAQAVTVDAGDEFFIALAANDTTGYSWSQSTADGKILAYEGNVYQGPSNGLVGAGGQQIFIYHANRSGSTAITFSYARPFEPNVAPTKRLTFNVVVR
jgi:inhibitor of cysteine peptidase